MLISTLILCSSLPLFLCTRIECAGKSRKVQVRRRLRRPQLGRCLHRTIRTQPPTGGTRTHPASPAAAARISTLGPETTPHPVDPARPLFLRSRSCLLSPVLEPQPHRRQSHTPHLVAPRTSGHTRSIAHPAAVLLRHELAPAPPPAPRPLASRVWSRRPFHPILVVDHFC